MVYGWWLVVGVWWLVASSFLYTNVQILIASIISISHQLEQQTTTDVVAVAVTPCYAFLRLVTGLATADE